MIFLSLRVIVKLNVENLKKLFFNANALTLQMYTGAYGHKC